MNDTCCSSHFGRLAAVSTLLGDNEISEISVYRNPGFISVNHFKYSIINFGHVINCFKNIILCRSRGQILFIFIFRFGIHFAQITVVQQCQLQVLPKSAKALLSSRLRNQPMTAPYFRNRPIRTALSIHQWTKKRCSKVRY